MTKLIQIKLIKKSRGQIININLKFSKLSNFFNG